MTGRIQNRTAFLHNVAAKLGRKPGEAVRRPSWSHKTVTERPFSDAQLDDLLTVFKEQCRNIHTDVIETTSAELKEAVRREIERLNGRNVVLWDDQFLSAHGLDSFENTERFRVMICDESLSREELKMLCAKADIGITASDISIAESGTVVLYSGRGKARSVSLLPESYFAILPKSSLVPRLTQAVRRIQERTFGAGDIPSCVQFISGPSNSADIEMSLVVGVHGPVRVTYFVVNDK